MPKRRSAVTVISGGWGCGTGCGLTKCQGPTAYEADTVRLAVQIRRYVRLASGLESVCTNQNYSAEGSNADWKYEGPQLKRSSLRSGLFSFDRMYLKEPMNETGNESALVATSFEDPGALKKGLPHIHKLHRCIANMSSK